MVPSQAHKSGVKWQEKVLIECKYFALFRNTVFLLELAVFLSIGAFDDFSANFRGGAHFS
jgi:hypothetical protein